MASVSAWVTPLAALAGPPVAGESDRVAAVRAAGHVTTHGEFNPGAQGAVAVITSDKTSADHAVRAVVTVAKEISASASRPAAE